MWSWMTKKSNSTTTLLMVLLCFLSSPVSVAQDFDDGGDLFAGEGFDVFDELGADDFGDSGDIKFGEPDDIDSADLFGDVSPLSQQPSASSQTPVEGGEGYLDLQSREALVAPEEVVKPQSISDITFIDPSTLTLPSIPVFNMVTIPNDYRSMLPEKLDFSAINWRSDRRKSNIILNGKTFYEGAEIGQAKLVKINERGVIMEVEDTQFEIQVKGSGF